MLSELTALVDSSVGGLLQVKKKKKEKKGRLSLEAAVFVL